MFEAVVERNLSRQDLQEHIERHFDRRSFGKLVLSDACALRPTSMRKPAVRPGRGTREAMRQTGAGACGDRINTQSGGIVLAHGEEKASAPADQLANRGLDRAADFSELVDRALKGTAASRGAPGFVDERVEPPGQQRQTDIVAP